MAINPLKPGPGWEFHPDLDSWIPPENDKPQPTDELPQVTEQEAYQARLLNAEAREAAEVLYSEAFKKAVQAVRDEIVGDFMRADAIEPDKLVLHKLRVQCLEDVLTKLKKQADQSAKARHIIEAFEEQKGARG